MVNVNNLYPASPLPTCDTATAPLSPSGGHTITRKPASINLLPIEILETIFIHCAFHHYHKAQNPTRRVPSWVNVSYVSRHWRNVALNCPTLWTHLFLTSPRWTDELLARSKQAPLKLHVNLHDPKTCFGYEPCFEQVTNHRERIQELLLDIWASESSYHFLRKFSLVPCAPRLQNLEISVVADSPSWEGPSVLFDGDTPVLRTLELRYCPLRWYSFKLGGLTTLYLHCVPDQVQQNAAEFLSTLSSMQDLTHLHLNHSLASSTGFVSSTTFQTFHKINLPRLSRLLIAAPYSTVVALLSCVNVPLKAQVRLQCCFEYNSDLSLYHALLCLSLTRWFNAHDDRAGSSLTIRSLVIERVEGSVGLTCSTSDRDCRSYLYKPEAEWDHIPLRIIADHRYSMTKSDQGHFISDICCSIPWNNVQTVHAIHSSYSPTFWRKTLGHLQDLRYLKLSLGNMPDLASVLSVTGPKGGYADRGPDGVLAPVLEELELYDVQLSSPLESRPTPQPAVDIQSLYDALSTREGSPGQLTISKCPIAMWGHDLVLHKVVGRWEGGRFREVEKQSRCHYYANSSSGSKYYGDSSD